MLQIVWDTRGAAAYKQGHIPGSINVDEIGSVLQFVFFMLRTFKFNDFEVFVSTKPTESRPPTLSVT